MAWRWRFMFLLLGSPKIIRERRGITADTAIRLGRYFKTTPRFWLNLQTAYDLETIEDETLAQIEREVRVGV
jgi:plasmid maintenance system antidote protein VapI